MLDILKTLAYLFALHTMEKELSEFLLFEYLSAKQSAMLKEQIITLLEKVRPQAVGLVDAFALPDYYLHSALGRYDGRVYESMTSMAESEPLNQTLVVPGYNEYIKPFVHAGKNRAAHKEEASKL
jgi:acyl-CoA oxidase